MALSIAEIDSRLQPYLLVHLDKKVLDLLTNSDFYRIYTDVSKDLNEEAELNQEVWENTGGATMAEDDEYTNYLMAGDIIKVYSFKYEGSDWRDQRYSYVNDRIILKDDANGIDMKIQYLRQCEAVTESADEIDLPDGVLTDFIELLKIRLRMDYGDLKNIDYESALKFYGEKASRHVPSHALKGEGIRRNWLELDDSDDNLYEIADRFYVGMENFTSDVNGNYTYVGD